jgi:molecular chaperone DnaK
MVSDSADSLDPSDKKSLEDRVAEAKTTLEGGDAEKIAAAIPRLEGEMHRVAEALYKAQAPPADAGGAGAGGMGDSPGAGPAKDDDVIDAEYTEEKGDS